MVLRQNVGTQGWFMLLMVNILYHRKEPGTYISAPGEFLPRSPGTHGGCSGLPHFLTRIETLMFIDLVHYCISTNSSFMYRSQSTHSVLNIILEYSGPLCYWLDSQVWMMPSENFEHSGNFRTTGFAPGCAPRRGPLSLSPKAPLYRHLSLTPRGHVLRVLSSTWIWVVLLTFLTSPWSPFVTQEHIFPRFAGPQGQGGHQWTSGRNTVQTHNPDPLVN